MDRVIILDADMASAFAKIKRLELLKRLFSKHRIVITPEIYEKFGLLTPDNSHLQRHLSALRDLGGKHSYWQKGQVSQGNHVSEDLGVKP